MKEPGAGRLLWERHYHDAFQASDADEPLQRKEKFLMVPHADVSFRIMLSTYTQT